jgi:hypothetical protein
VERVTFPSTVTITIGSVGVAELRDAAIGDRDITKLEIMN